VDRLADLLGVVASTRASMRVAVSALRRSAPAEARDGPLDKLLAMRWETVDLGQGARQASRYKKSLRSLARAVALDQSPGWRALQEAIVAAGVGARDNPVPALHALAGDRDPSDLTGAWAVAQSRHFRSTKAFPPHGRADLSITLANNIARLDALHAIPELRNSGLLPEPIGQVL